MTKEEKLEEEEMDDVIRTLKRQQIVDGDAGSGNLLTG